MRVLVIGSGGRESAIVYKLAQSPKVEKIYAMPGNPGMAAYAELAEGSVTDFDRILEFVNTNAIDLTVVGPEVPLCLGFADKLTKEGHPVFGPSARAAQLEGSKAYSKAFMEKYNIPTAAYVEADKLEDAFEAIRKFSYPLVIKADGLAAGKGVVICEDEEAAKSTLKEMLVDGILDGAGSKVVIEEFLKGFECSLLCFCDGDTIVPMVSCKDHKQIFDNNKGPNTGGMGTVSPNPFLPKEISDKFDDVVLKPFMNGIKGEGLDFRGVIFIGLMIDGDDIKVLEFNVRFGDPETQVIMLRLDSDLAEIMKAVAKKKLKDIEVRWKDETACCLVLASGGYPGSYKKGIEITGTEDVSDEIVLLHAGTKLSDGILVTDGGRVLNICATGSDLTEARNKVYEAAEKINFDGKYFRKDIGLN